MNVRTNVFMSVYIYIHVGTYIYILLLLASDVGSNSLLNVLSGICTVGNTRPRAGPAYMCVCSLCGLFYDIFSLFCGLIYHAVSVYSFGW
jgi:hypothetical protein